MHNSCNSSDELHHCRHKDILTLIRELENLDEAKKASIAAYGKRKDSADSGMLFLHVSSAIQGS